MWYRRNVERFLDSRKVGPEEREVVLSRVEEVSDEHGRFLSHDLTKVMGNPRLADEYKQAWETDPRLY
jgi:hypothetical protein